MTQIFIKKTMTTLILTTNKKVLLNCDSTNEFTKKLSAT